jgi:4'-phosphopantetheinyl transferase
LIVVAHVYYAFSTDVDPESDASRLLATLSEEERERHGKFRFKETQHTYLVAHALVRNVLAEHCGVAASDIVLTAGPHGRPEIASPQAATHVRFNLSHTDGLVAVVVAPHMDVGIDVEHVQRRLNIPAVSRHVFSPAELVDLHSLSGDAQRRRFFQYWTLKEAYIKAVGQGFALGLTQIEMSILEPHAATVRFGPSIADDASRWRLEWHAIGDAFLLSLALATSSREPVRFEHRFP